MATVNFDRLRLSREEAARSGAGSRQWIEFATLMFDAFPSLYETAKLMNKQADDMQEKLRIAESSDREQQLETALRNLLGAIVINTDCMDNRVDRLSLDEHIERAEDIVEAVPTGHFLGTWISVKKDLPDADTTVFVSIENNSDPVWLGYHDGLEWLSVDGMPIEVTAWAEMPEPFPTTPTKGENA